MEKVLIAYASYGSGHKTAAQAIYNYYQDKDEYIVKIIDINDYFNIIGLITLKLYYLSLKKEELFTFLYNITDHKFFNNIYIFITKIILKKRKLKKEICNFNPDLLIATHFFPEIYMGILNRKKITNCNIISISTDYNCHQFQISNYENEEALVVASDIVKEKMKEKGLSEDKIYAYGIPINKKFDDKESNKLIKKRYNINNNKKTCLFFAGGSRGSNNSYKYFRKLLEEDNNINIIFVAGTNEKLKLKCEKLVLTKKYTNIVILGFSLEVNKLIKISDMVISKPGGLSVTEIIKMKKPILLIPGNGGQEKYNADFVVNNGLGYYCKNKARLVKNVNRLLYDRGELSKIIDNLIKYNDNESLDNIYELGKKILNNK